MKQGNFCFIKNDYYKDFPDKNLMINKESVDKILHNRPCFFAIQDTLYKEIFWLVPISTKYDKYKVIYDSKVAKYGKCNTIMFGKVLDKKSVFLIQNTFPVTKKYISEIYIDKNSNLPVAINNVTSKDIISNVRTVLEMKKRNINLIFPDIDKIKSGLLRQLSKEKSIDSQSLKPSFNEKLLSAKKEAEQRNTLIKSPKDVDKER